MEAFESVGDVLRRLAPRDRPPPLYAGPPLNWDHPGLAHSKLMERFAGRWNYTGPMLGSSAAAWQKCGRGAL